MLDWFTSKGRLWRFESLCALKFHYIKLSCLRLFSFLHTHTHTAFSRLHITWPKCSLISSSLHLSTHGCWEGVSQRTRGGRGHEFLRNRVGICQRPQKQTLELYPHTHHLFYIPVCISLFICYAMLLDYLLKFLKIIHSY